MRRGAAAALVAGLLATGCSHGASSPTTTATPPAGAGSSKVVVLDSSNFDALVLALPRPSLVKFQSPT